MTEIDTYEGWTRRGRVVIGPADYEVRPKGDGERWQNAWSIDHTSRETADDD